MRYEFIHEGCDTDLSKEAASITQEVIVIQGMAGSTKLRVTEAGAERRYYSKYEALFREKYGYPTKYNPISTAPENEEVSVMWGNINGAHEFGRAVRRGTTWSYRRRSIPHENGDTCATPTAWCD